MNSCCLYHVRVSGLGSGLVSLDLEGSAGLDGLDHAVPLQVAVTSPTCVDVFVSDIRFDRFVADPDAMRVHGITDDRVAAAPVPAEVDSLLVEWFEVLCRVTGVNSFVPVGRRTGDYDVPLVSRWLPLSAGFLASAEDLAASDPVCELCRVSESETVVDMLGSWESVHGGLRGRHDAEFDALHAVACRWVRSEGAHKVGYCDRCVSRLPAGRWLR